VFDFFLGTRGNHLIFFFSISCFSILCYF
jgi:hypothetical protein